MSHDIAHVLEGWNFEPHELNVRIITGDDGQSKIQMRIDLGLLQMNIDGRPDGQKPFGHESLLDYYEQQAAEYGKGYYLSSDATDELFREGWQFYHRYLCLFHLSRFDLVVRDTTRSLRLFAFVKKYAKKKRDQWRFDQYRPYVIMMNTRACAMMALQRGDRETALTNVAAGRIGVEEFLAEYNKSQDESECFELEFLKRWDEELRQDEGTVEAIESPEATKLAKLRTHLEKAIRREDYEYAAVLRDQIKRMENQGLPPGRHE